MSYVDIKNHNGLVRDLSSGAVLNVNQSDYENYLSMRQKKKLRDAEFHAQQEKINNLTNEVNELKALVTTLIERTTKD